MSSFQVEFPPYFVDEKPREIITQAYGFEVGFILPSQGPYSLIQWSPIWNVNIGFFLEESRGSRRDE